MCQIRTPAGWSDKTEHRQVLGCRWLHVLGCRWLHVLGSGSRRGRKELLPAVPVGWGLWQFVC